MHAKDNTFMLIVTIAKRVHSDQLTHIRSNMIRVCIACHSNLVLMTDTPF